MQSHNLSDSPCSNSGPKNIDKESSLKSHLPDNYLNSKKKCQSPGAKITLSLMTSRASHSIIKPTPMKSASSTAKNTTSLTLKSKYHTLTKKTTRKINFVHPKMIFSLNSKSQENLSITDLNQLMKKIMTKLQKLKKINKYHSLMY